MRKSWDLVRIERKAGGRLRDGLRAWPRGFLRWNYLQCQSALRAFDGRGFIDDLTSWAVHPKINRGARALLKDKLTFATRLERAGFRTAAPRAAVCHGQILPVDGPPVGDVEAWLAAHIDGKGLVFKPQFGSRGRGIFFVGDGPTLNGRPLGFDELCNLVCRLQNYAIFDKVEQGPFARELFDRTTNSLRVLTLWHPADARPFVARAALRIGTHASFPVDNFSRSSGGLSAHVDVDSGRLSAAVLGTRSGPKLHRRHPESGAVIEGRQIPNWPTIVEDVRKLACHFSEARLVAWDLALAEGDADRASPGESDVVVIEANATPALTVFQVHRPMLVDPRVRGFYRHFGVF